MKKRSTTNQFSVKLYRALIIPVALVVGLFVITGTVKADTFDDQINQLQNEVNSYQAEAGRLRAQADTFQNAVNALNAQKMAIQAQLDLTQTKLDRLNADIVANQLKLEKQQAVLGSTISDLSAESTTSPIELLAGSNSIGDFIDRQEYRTSVQEQIQNAIKLVKELKEELASQKVQVEQVLGDQTAQRNDLATKEAEQASLLAQTQGQESAYQNLIGSKNSQISGLQAQQAAANARFIGPVGSGPACGGGYPGQWCNIPMDTVVDNWGMYNRECVSYTAFRVAASGRHMPYWGGVGNANQWDENAINAGIPTDYTPRAGDVAISNNGYYGHAMYVESVNANGTINISQYNASWTGTYSTNTISPSGLVFIHF
ncbi:MAG: CHAP domain-containing protein [Candidatus Saccharimonadales bacterium]